MAIIKSGYYLKARSIQDSKIAHAPPYVREIWDWLLKEANHIDTRICKRGQTVRTFKDIQEGLCWYVGWRKHTYTKSQCEKAMKYLRKETMIATEKTTRGMLITVVNYNKFQDPKNYERNDESNRRATQAKQSSDTINKNDKNVENDKNISSKEDIEAEPQTFGREDINTCMDFLKENLGVSLDGSIGSNRKYCKLLIDRMKKDYPGKDSVLQVKALITYGLKDDFHAKNITNFQYLYQNAQKIIQSVKLKQTKAITII